MQTSQEHFTTIVYAHFFFGGGGGANRVHYGKLGNRELGFYNKQSIYDKGTWTSRNILRLKMYQIKTDQ